MKFIPANHVQAFFQMAFEYNVLGFNNTESSAISLGAYIAEKKLPKLTEEDLTLFSRIVRRERVMHGLGANKDTSLMLIHDGGLYSPYYSLNVTRLDVTTKLFPSVLCEILGRLDFYVKHVKPAYPDDKLDIEGLGLFLSDKAKRMLCDVIANKPSNWPMLRGMYVSKDGAILTRSTKH